MVAWATSASFGQQAVNKAIIEAEKKTILEAVKKADEEVDKAPTKAKLWLTRSQANLSVAFFRSDSSLATTIPDAAEKAWKYANEAIKLDTKDGKKGSVAKEVDKLIESQQFSIAYLNMAVWHFQNKNFVAALPQMKMASDLAPKDSTIALNWAITADQIQEDEAAKVAYERYLSNGGKDIGVFLSLTRLYRNSNEEEKAIKYIDLAIAAYPGKGDVLREQKFGLFLAFKRFDEASEFLKQSLSVDPKNSLTYLRLGQLDEQKVSDLTDNIKQIRNKLASVQEVNRRLSTQLDQIAVYRDELTKSKTKLSKEKVAKAKASINNQILTYESKIKDFTNTLKVIQTQKDSVILAVGDSATNATKMKELNANVKVIRTGLPNYYLKAIEMDPKNFDALFLMGFYYFTDSQDFKRLKDEMTLEAYKTKGKDLDVQIVAKYNEALPFLTRAYDLKKDDELKEVLREIYRELKDEAKLAELEK
jgi:Tfp pilus assembly protein PilF